MSHFFVVFVCLFSFLVSISIADDKHQRVPHRDISSKAPVNSPTLAPSTVFQRGVFDIFKYPNTGFPQEAVGTWIQTLSAGPNYKGSLNLNAVTIPAGNYMLSFQDSKGRPRRVASGSTLSYTCVPGKPGHHMGLCQTSFADFQQNVMQLIPQPFCHYVVISKVNGTIDLQWWDSASLCNFQPFNPEMSTVNSWYAQLQTPPVVYPDSIPGVSGSCGYADAPIVWPASNELPVATPIK